MANKERTAVSRGKKTAAGRTTRRPKHTNRAKKSKACQAAESFSSPSAAVTLVETPRGATMLRLRSRLHLNRETFARLLPVSTRLLANIEKGEPASDAVIRRLTEIRRVVDSLSEVISEDVVGFWMVTPNDAFGALKPIEVVERGEIDRIWQMIYQLRSGVNY